MKYSINKTNYKKFPLFEENKLPPRAYFIPYSDKETLEHTRITEERYSSDRVRVLNGEWDFRYYKKVSEMPAVIDTDNIDFDKITVPSDWQRTGYEKPVYVNSRYQFKLRPPHIPEDIPVGVYRKIISVEEKPKRSTISFLGVISSLDLYVNGAYVGYSEGAHNTAEFDITPFLTEGENEIVAVVFKWSNGTYLECQDMFRENGIFRDVLLFEEGDVCLWDFQIKSKRNKSGRYDLNAEIELKGKTDDYSVEFVLLDGGKTFASACSPAAQTVKIGLNDLPVQEWNAEIPKVYETYITLKKGNEPIETLRSYTGFKTIEIEGNVFYLNNKKIKLKGVNHHDTNPKTGYVMSPQDWEKDVETMKHLNVNTVRTSHYPPDPLFLTLCDIFGIYVIDEADIETHGCYAKAYKPNLISNNLKWVNHYLDRVGRMYYRDRNHPSVLMWSLGNEAGGWKCQDRCYAMLKQLCPEIPVHYEGVIRTRRHHYDVFSEMYTDIARVRAIRKGEASELDGRAPFFLCEYAHAMGVGPGGLKEYVDEFYLGDNLLGGCIWEWADHAVYHEGDDSPYKYTYGGDHDEPFHDGNFCVDGLVYPDRTPHSGAYEMMTAYRPVRAELKESGVYTFENTNRFRTVDDMTIRWEFICNGHVLEQGEVMPCISPCGKQDVEIPHAIPDTNHLYHITFTYLDRHNEVVAKEQIKLSSAPVRIAPGVEGEISVTERSGVVGVLFDGGEVCFQRKTGAMVSYTYGDREILNTTPAAGQAGVMPNLYRAPLDNDMYIRKDWEKFGLQYGNTVLDDFSVQTENNRVIVCATYIIRSGKKDSRRRFFLGNKDLYAVEIRYTILPNGVVTVRERMLEKLSKKAPKELPRFGIQLELQKNLRNVTYFGNGDRENLTDFCIHTTKGIYSASVENMHEPYIRPQDNGNRSDTTWAKFTDNSGFGLLVFNETDSFSFSAHEYTQKLLQEAKHIEDLHDENTVCLSIDGFMRGAGSNSCGPAPWSEHIVNAEANMQFSVSFVPVDAKKVIV